MFIELFKKKHTESRAFAPVRLPLYRDWLILCTVFVVCFVVLIIFGVRYNRYVASEDLFSSVEYTPADETFNEERFGRVVERLNEIEDYRAHISELEIVGDPSL